MDWWQTWQRRRVLRSCAAPESVRTWLSASWPKPEDDWRRVRFTALDLETSGLQPRENEILSIGMVDGEGGALREGSAWQSLVRPPDGHRISEASTQIHGLDARRLADAPRLGEVLPSVLERLAGSVLMVHVSQVDHPFLARALRAHYGCGLWMPTLDTARLCAWFDYHPQLGKGRNEVIVFRRLTEIAAELGVEAGRPHDALEDALTCARIFIAMSERLEQLSPVSLGRLRRIAG